MMWRNPFNTNLAIWRWNLCNADLQAYEDSDGLDDDGGLHNDDCGLHDDDLGQQQPQRGQQQWGFQQHHHNHGILSRIHVSLHVITVKGMKGGSVVGNHRFEFQYLGCFWIFASWSLYVECTYCTFLHSANTFKVLTFFITKMHYLILMLLMPHDR